MTQIPRRALHIAVLVLASAGLAGCNGGSATPTPGFSSTGSMSVSRLGHAAALLGNGRILIAGGCESIAHQVTCWSSAELYDPGSGTFSPTGSMSAERSGAPATVLPDGKVLIAGGYRLDGAGATVPLASAELYDPASGAFTATGSMGAARYKHTATLLPDGRVLVAGGTGDRVTLTSAELYDPRAGTFSPAGSMTTARVGHTATRLQNGKVLIAAGSQAVTPADATYLASAELFDPESGTFAATGSMGEARYSPTAVRLADGRVLVAGGMRYVEPPAKVSLATAELFDAAGTSAGYTGSMGSARMGPACVLLPNGRVLMAGGMIVDTPSSPASYLASAELFYPASGTFGFAGSMSDGRMGATATLLNDGRVLIVGGGGSEDTLASAEIYQP